MQQQRLLMDIWLYHSENNIIPVRPCNAFKRSHAHVHLYSKAIHASTHPAITPAPHEYIRDAAPIVCSAGAGGTEEAALDDGETEASSVGAVAELLSCVFVTADEPNLCEEEECECLALSVVSIEGRLMVVFDAP
ncbi:hypothetical protein PSPO01_01603 [Paraphaeosphaeria sporulosa]